MKKYIALLSLCLLTMFASAQSTTPRYGTTPNSDNTGRVLTYKYQAKAYADTIKITPSAWLTNVKAAQLTGNAIVIVQSTAYSYYGDQIVFTFTADGSARTLTFVTNMIASATLVVDSAQSATISFMFNGTKFIETARAKE